MKKLLIIVISIFLFIHCATNKNKQKNSRSPNKDNISSSFLKWDIGHLNYYKLNNFGSLFQLYETNPDSDSNPNVEIEQLQSGLFNVIISFSEFNVEDAIWNQQDYVGSSFACFSFSPTYFGDWTGLNYQNDDVIKNVQKMIYKIYEIGEQTYYTYDKYGNATSTPKQKVRLRVIISVNRDDCKSINWYNVRNVSDDVWKNAVKINYVSGPWFYIER